jgi:putative cell wall-binding protein
MYGRLALVVAVVASTFSIIASPPAVAAEDEVYPIVFPVVGDVYYTDTFGACRAGCSRPHLGNDLMTYGYKGVPVVAAHDGVIRNTSTALGRACCAIWGLRADDGWESWYIHMNNDTPFTDDGKGWGFAPGIDVGTRVTAGQLIGWVGDSGNAENTGPHIQFELHKPDGTVISPYASLQAATRVDLPRIWGANRFNTAAEIAMDEFPEGSDTVFVTTGRKFPDALSVGAVSASLGVPIILTEPGSLPTASRDAVAAMNPSEIVVVGGPEAVSAGVEAALEAIAPVRRIGGVNRYETATMVADAFFDQPSTVYVAYGYSYPEAVSASVTAGTSSGPLILTDDGSVPGTTVAYLSALESVEVVVIGGTGAVSSGVIAAIESIPSVTSVTRIGSGGASDVSIDVSQSAFPDGSGAVYLATAGDYADALAGASLAGRNDAPILLLTDSGLGAVVDEVARLGATDITVLGGPEAVGYGWIEPFWSASVGNTMPIWK